MILVDSSVWIDYLRGTSTSQATKLDALLGAVPLAIGDLRLAEVLQGCSTEREFNQVRRMLGTLDMVTVGGESVAVEAARNFRRLRARGITVRKTIDKLTPEAAPSPSDPLGGGNELLHNDRDFDAFEEHLGLRCVG